MHESLFTAARRTVDFPTVFRKEDWRVGDLDLKAAQSLVAAYHYAKGGSKTAVYVHGLFYKATNDVCGVVWWIPPTREACESVNRKSWQKVLGLTRMVVVPGVPKNACSFLLARSVKAIERDGRFVSLVTYADESQGHEGTVYRAANWFYIGRTKFATDRWLDGDRQVAIKANKSRTNAQMLALGYVNTGKFFKHKFEYHFDKDHVPRKLLP